QTLTISNTGGSDLDWNLSVDDVTKSYTLTRSGPGTFTLDGKTVTVNPEKATPLKGDFEDLTGVNILYDLSISSYVVLRSDLELRGATFTQITHPLTDLSPYNIFITDDSHSDSWTGGEYILLQDWVAGGGALFIDGDNSDELSHYNALIPVSAGITMNANGDFVAPTPIIYQHEITDSVASVYSTAAGSWLTLSAPAERILEYDGGTIVDGEALMAASKSGLGKVVVIGDELFNEYNISDNDNQLLANQTFDWLVGSSTIVTDVESGTIFAGSSEDVLISVHTIGMNAGVYNYNINITSNDPVDPEVDVPFDLTVIGVPNISVQDSVDFDEVFTGVTDSQIVTIDNIGTDVLNISSVDFGLTEYTIDMTAFTVPPKSSVERRITFSSLLTGIFNSTMIFNSNDPDEPARAVELTAEAVDPPIIGVSPTFFDVTLNSGDSTTQTLTISNTGGSDLEWDLETSYITAKSGTSELYERYKDNVIYEYHADKYRSGNRKIAPIPLDELNSLKGNTKILSWIKFTDASTYSNTINAISQYYTECTFDTTTTINQVKLGTLLNNADVFIIPPQFGGYSTFFNSLGSSWSSVLNEFVNYGGIIIQCGATADYYFGSDALLNSAGLFSFQSIDYITSGTMNVDNTHFITEKIPSAINAQPYTFFSNITDSEAVELVTYSGNNTLAIKEIGRGGIVVLGNDFYNYDNDVAMIISNAVQWKSSTNLISNPDSGTIPAGSSEDVLISVHTIGLNAGVYNYNIKISSNDPVNPEVDVPFDLTVVGVPNISVQDSVNFDEVFTGVTDSQIVTIDNIGTDVLNISSVDFDLTEYSIDATVFSVPPKSSVERTITFNSPVAGTFTSIMTAHSNDPDDPAKTVVITADAVDPPIIGVSPAFFDVTLNSGDSTTQTLTISNTGGSDLDWYIDIFEVGAKAKTVSLYDQYKHLVNYEVSSDKYNSGKAKVAPIPLSKIEELKGDIQILAWTTYADMAREYPNTINAISQYFTDFTISTSTSTDPTVLNTELSDKDVLLIPEQEGGSESIFTALGSSWTTTLTNFVNNGGTIILCGSYISSPSHEILNTSGLMTMSYYDYSSSSTMAVDTTHFITSGVPASITAQNLTVLYDITDPSTIDLVTISGYTTIAAKEMGRGHIVVLGYDFYDYDDNAAKLISNAVQWSGGSGVDPDIESGTIFAGSSEDVLISVHTIDMNAGVYNYNINISSNDPVDPEVDVPLDLTVIGAPNISMQDSVDFDKVFTGVTDSQIVTIDNIGTDVLNISSVDFDLTEFSIDATVFSVPPKSSVERTITFNSPVTGTFTSIMTAHSNDPDEPAKTTVLTAEAVNPPIISVSPDSFYVSLKSGDSTTQTLTISNT
ncbi:MAG: choice-of-anchor D domain-containing protein, partial [Candidatus Delongbacteria bacterium]|nr:choice-of-anchor D domain-containing protein [Candidatus Delongbacteria bacterium]